MPKTTFQTPQPPLFERLKGDYPFEVVAFEQGISKGNKTRGSDVVTLKLKFFRDETFAEALSQWEEDLIFHPSCEWKIHQFLLCANFQVDGRLVRKSDEIEITEHNTVGLRGWATCAPEPDATDKTKEWNRVRVFITEGKPKLAKHVDVGAPVNEDDVPF